MKVKMKIEITEEDIENFKKRDPEYDFTLDEILQEILEGIYDNAWGFISTADITFVK